MKRFIRILCILWSTFFGIGFLVTLISKSSNIQFWVVMLLIGIVPLFFIKTPKQVIEKDLRPKASGAFVEGPPFITKGAYCSIILDNDILEIRPAKSNNVLSLNVNQIVAISSVTDREIIESSRSVVGRAAAGGLLFGGLGAIVGGMSGVSPKKKVKMRYFLILNYRSADASQINIISFETFMPVSSKFLTAVQVKIPAQSIQL